jgi:hypothetical protein
MRNQRNALRITVLSAIVIFSLIRVAATHRVFSQTFDEGIHIAAGHEWLTEPPEYQVDAQHPPLARILFGLPFIHLSEASIKSDPIARGNKLLNYDDRYIHNLAHARLGNLVFLALGIVAVFLWGQCMISPEAGIIAAALFASLPPVLAHAGLATTDMAITAMLSFALYWLTIWLDSPTWPRTLMLGIAVGLGVLSKYSFLLFFPIAAAIVFFVRRRLPLLRGLAAAAIAFVLCWGGYRSSVGTIRDAHWNGALMVEELFGSQRMADVRLPMPAFFVGLIELQLHNRRGHFAFALGQISRQGWWWYFPLTLAVKTPIPFLALSIAGFGVALKQRRAVEVALIPVALLGASTLSHINLGVRHVLPLYAMMAVLAALACTELRRARAAVIALVAWTVVGSVLAHPDYLPWLNAFAGNEPARVLVDSNFDWGQDVLRLARTCRRLRIERLSTNLFTSADLECLGLPRHEGFDPKSTVAGWTAISETQFRELGAESPGAFWGYKGRSFRRVGSTIRLYYLPEDRLHQ